MTTRECILVVALRIAVVVVLAAAFFAIGVMQGANIISFEFWLSSRGFVLGLLALGAFYLFLKLLIIRFLHFCLEEKE